MARIEKRLEEAKEKLRKIKGMLFKALDNENPEIMKERIVEILKEL